MNKKKLFIGIAALVLFIVVALFYLNYRNRSMSPQGAASLTSGGMTVNVTYSRPSVRGRVIFGAENQNALQPYGKYWRLGANESTEITVNRDITFNGTPLKAGTYRIYAIPGAQSFEIGVNSEVGKWGAWEPDYNKDLFKTSVPVQSTSAPVELLTISLAPQGEGIDMICEWATTRFVIPLRAQ